ncbi:aldehyde dehydrogenase family protein [Nakamurella flavida]|uniref:Aldehyde dehydrogenase family protein n=1 Tax=Nakamurella flavida TaxID=363630 RepID=A0A939C4C0_9ACTN|nr:aldehyde dehydrogenase family protein [Nakamurella flavida]MBM9477946.1 aldehyde dehydrogenase family protein [Nakamurella flavida]MDP9778338.1 NADP-dependent aldehyde dehydrogenase [Nakamurella flavida]
MPVDVSTAPATSSTSTIDALIGRGQEVYFSTRDAQPSMWASWMTAVADALDAAADHLVGIAERETHLTPARLSGEVTRTSGQLRLLAAAALDGSCYELTIDHADPEKTPPRPDLRRMLQGVGPVVVFAASNFPFAFSVLGGDTAAAWAAGCPVLLKIHSGHPELSWATLQVARTALRAAGAPPDWIIGFTGQQAGRQALADPRVKAGAFTGSEHVGRQLLSVAQDRPDPIPFYGELGSVNPVVVLPAAARHQREQIAGGLAASFTLGRGQFCTKPGVVAVPASARLGDAVTAHLSGMDTGALLTESIGRAFVQGTAELGQLPGVLVDHDARSTVESAGPWLGSVRLADVIAAPDAYLAERFGPATLLITYEDTDSTTVATQLASLSSILPGSLTGTVHADLDDESDIALAGTVVDRLRHRCGRIIMNSWPTGVAVAWAMHHGGPWPATTGSLHTSVGPTSIRRFLTPVSFQDMPQGLLPPVLQDGRTDLTRRIDGRLVPAA